MVWAKVMMMTSRCFDTDCFYFSFFVSGFEVRDFLQVLGRTLFFGFLFSFFFLSCRAKEWDSKGLFILYKSKGRGQLELSWAWKTSIAKRNDSDQRLRARDDQRCV